MLPSAQADHRCRSASAKGLPRRLRNLIGSGWMPLASEKVAGFPEVPQIFEAHNTRGHPLFKGTPTQNQGNINILSVPSIFGKPFEDPVKSIEGFQCVSNSIDYWNSFGGRSWCPLFRVMAVMATELGGAEVKVMAVIAMNSPAFRPNQWEATIEDVPNLDLLFSPGDFKTALMEPLKNMHEDKHNLVRKTGSFWNPVRLRLCLHLASLRNPLNCRCCHSISFHMLQVHAPTPLWQGHPRRIPEAKGKNSTLGIWFSLHHKKHNLLQDFPYRTQEIGLASIRMTTCFLGGALRLRSWPRTTSSKTSKNWRNRERIEKPWATLT